MWTWTRQRLGREHALVPQPALAASYFAQRPWRYTDRDESYDEFVIRVLREAVNGAQNECPRSLERMTGSHELRLPATRRAKGRGATAGEG